MARVRGVRLVMGGMLVGLAACGDREPPPPAAVRPPAVQVVDSVRAAADTLRGDSIMVRDTARIPE